MKATPLVVLLLANIAFSGPMLEKEAVASDVRLYSALFFWPVVFLVTIILVTRSKRFKAYPLIVIALIVAIFVNVIYTLSIEPSYKKTFNGNRFYVYSESNSVWMHTEYEVTIAVRNFIFEEQLSSFSFYSHPDVDDYLGFIRSLNYKVTYPTSKELVGSWTIKGSPIIKLEIDENLAFQYHNYDNGKSEILTGTAILKGTELKLDYSDSIMQRLKYFKFYKEDGNLYISDFTYRLEKTIHQK